MLITINYSKFCILIQKIIFDQKEDEVNDNQSDILGKDHQATTKET